MSPDALTVALAAEVRNRFDTPCYVYDHSIIEATARRALAFPARGLRAGAAPGRHRGARPLARGARPPLRLHARNPTPRLAATERSRGRKPRFIYELKGEASLSGLIERLISASSVVAPTGRDRTRRIQVRAFIAR